MAGGIIFPERTPTGPKTAAYIRRRCAIAKIRKSQPKASGKPERTALPQLSKKRTVVSKTAYLAGVPKQFFENGYEPPDMAVYQELEERKPARIVRNLCILRTEVMHRFKMRQTRKPGQEDAGILSDLVPTDTIDRLHRDGALYFPSPAGLYDHLFAD